MTMRKPTAMKHLQGTARPDRVNPNEPQPPVASGYCPRDLPASAKHWWRRTAPSLKALGLLTVLDVAAARDMAICATRLAQAEVIIEDMGILVKGARGGVVRNPAIAVANQYRAALYAWLREFGMTPAARSRIDLPAPEEPEGEAARFERYQAHGLTLRMGGGEVDHGDESPDS